MLLFARRNDEAIELAARGLEFDPNPAFAPRVSGSGYAERAASRRRSTHARAATARLEPDHRWRLQAYVLAVAGRDGSGLKLIRQVEESTKGRYFCPYEIGAAYASLGDTEPRHRWFRKGVDGARRLHGMAGRRALD